MINAISPRALHPVWLGTGLPPVGIRRGGTPSALREGDGVQLSISQGDLKGRLEVVFTYMEENGKGDAAAKARKATFLLGDSRTMGSKRFIVAPGTVTLNPSIFDDKSTPQIADLVDQAITQLGGGATQPTQPSQPTQPYNPTPPAKPRPNSPFGFRR